MTLVQVRIIDCEHLDMFVLIIILITFRTMDIAPTLRQKLDVKYTAGVEEKARKKIKRKEHFKGQVAQTVRQMEVGQPESKISSD